MTGGEAGRFAAFYREHYSLILTMCTRRLGNRAAAEDATAEVFRVVWQRYSKEEPALATLYTIARNVVGNEYRRAGRASAVRLRLEQETLPAVADDVPAVELRAALLRLKANDRELLYMAYWEDLTAKEIAEIVNSSPGAVWVRLTRVREALRDILSGPVAKLGERHG